MMINYYYILKLRHILLWKFYRSHVDQQLKEKPIGKKSRSSSQSPVRKKKIPKPEPVGSFCRFFYYYFRLFCNFNYVYNE